MEFTPYIFLIWNPAVGILLALWNTHINNDHCPTAAAGCILLPPIALPFILIEYFFYTLPLHATEDLRHHYQEKPIRQQVNQRVDEKDEFEVAAWKELEEFLAKK